MIRLYDTPPSYISHTQLNSMIQASYDASIMGECESVFVVCGVVFTQRESTAREVWFSPPAMCVEDATGPVGNAIEWPSVVLLLSRNGQNRSDAGAKVLLCVSPLRS